MTCVETARGFLAAVGSDAVDAWEVLDAAQLIADAEALDALGSEARGALPLFGTLIGIKDNIDTRRLATGYGSPIYAGHRPDTDAEVVRRLVAAGALVAGKTRCTEFAWMHPTSTRNPLDPARTPGGSSSGSAAAVAAGHVPVALGTQTAGSVNRPASYCAVVGYKATYGLIPTDGIKAQAPSLDTVGVLGHSVGDVRRVAGVLSAGAGFTTTGASDGDVSPGPPGPPGPPGAARIGFARTPLWDGRVEPAARAAIETAVAAIPGVVELELPDGYVELVEAQSTIQTYEAARALRPEFVGHRELLSDWLRGELERGAAIASSAYERALAARSSAGVELLGLLSEFDAVLTPSTTGVPPLGLGATGDALFCRAWTFVGAPTVSLPLAWTPERLPVGLQLAAAPGSDETLLTVAAALMD